MEGSPEVRSFTRQDGTAGASLSLRVREVQLLGSKSDNGGSSSPAYSGAASASSPASSSVPSPNEITEPIDDLPF